MTHLWGSDMMKKLLTSSLLMLLCIGFFTPLSLYAFNDGDLIYLINNPNDYGDFSSDQFGISVDINDTYMIVGARYEEDIIGSNNGKAYLFENSTGDLIYTFDNPHYNNTSSTDYFSWSVAIGDRYVGVGAPYEDIVNSNSGIIYIYSIEDGSLWRGILNPNYYDTQDNDVFGNAIAMHGDYLLVGVATEDSSVGTSSGVAYLYNVHTGELLHTIENPSMYGTIAGDNFGYAVDLNENYMIISANYEDDIGGSTSGAVYVFDVLTGDLIYSIPNPNNYGTVVGDAFGMSVAINDDYFVVGTHYEDDITGSSSGVAYVFNTSTGALLNTITNPNIFNTGSNDYFGYDLDLYDKYLVVSAYQEDSSRYSNEGVAYVFDVSTNTLLYTYEKQDPTHSYNASYIGQSVGISNGYILVGVPRANNYDDPLVYSNASGVVYVFQNTLTIIENTVTFDTNGGSTISPIDIVDNNLLTPPSDPTKSDYLFERWYIDEDLTIAFDFTDPIKDDLTLYARWIEDTGGGSGGVSGGLTNNTAFMIVAIILYLALLVIRFLSGVRVWNLFGIGILIYFIIQYSNIIPMVIVLIGFIIYQLYDTFIGGK